MSVQEVVDYVMESPNNTNPTILKQKINEYAEKMVALAAPQLMSW